MTKKLTKRMALGLLVTLMVLSLVACGNKAKKSYTVTFDSNGGSIVEAVTVEAGQSVAKPSDPTRNGYSFVNWSASNTGEVVDFPFTPSASIMLKASWKADNTVTSHTITFNSNGGSDVLPVTVVAGSSINEPAQPKRAGYSFLGLRQGSASTVVSFPYTSTSSLVLTAVWESHFEYKLNGDTVYLTGLSNIGQKLTIIETPSSIEGKSKIIIGNGVAGGDRFVRNFDNIETLVINQNVIEIRQMAFDYYYRVENGIGTHTLAEEPSRLKLRNVIFEQGITSIKKIGMYAFYGCDNLTSIDIPQGVEIESSAFQHCVGLKHVTIGEGLTSIGSGTFEGCTSLASIIIPNTVTRIDYAVFKGCSSLTSITIPDTVTEIGSGYGIFKGCNSLASVNVGKNNESFSSVDGILFNKSGTELLFCPAKKSGEYQIPGGVSKIRFDAFYDCNSLTRIMIPKGVDFYESTFELCASLTNITVSVDHASYSSIGGVLFDKAGTKLMFYPKGKVGSYTVPKGVTHIDSKAFTDSVGLSGIVFADSIVSIGRFDNCSNLINITLSPNATIDHSYLYGCSSLENIYVDSASEEYTSIDGVLFDKAGTKLMLYPSGRAGHYNIPHGVTDIDGGAFHFTTELVSVFYPETLTGSAYGMKGYSQDNLLNIYVDENNPVYSSVGGVLYSKDKTTLINYPSGRFGSFKIPDGVTSIAASAFSNCLYLTDITIPSSVTEINSHSFFGLGMGMLKNINFIGRSSLPAGWDNSWFPSTAEFHWNYQE